MARTLLKRAALERPTLRKVSTVESTDGTRRATVYRDVEWGEYRVSFTLNGTHKPAADYHTDDKGDATATARHFCHLDGGAK